MSVADLEAVIAPPQALPGVSPDSLSGLAWLPAIEVFIFSSASGYHLVTSNGALRWTIPARYQPNGWLALESDLYVQDGCVISQYDLLALQRTVAVPSPDNACNLRTGLSWSAQQAGHSIDSILSDADATDLAYSAPVSAWSGSSRMVYVLSAAGRIYGLPTNLSLNAPPFMSSLPPDRGLGLFGSGEQRVARLRYLGADGKVVTLKVRPLGIESALPSGVRPAAWNGLNRAAASPGAWSYTLEDVAAPTSMTVSALRPSDTGGSATDQVTLTWVDPVTTQWRVLYLDAGARPFKPPRATQARLASDGSGGPPPRLLAPPCALADEGATFLCALTAPPAGGSAAVSLQKFKLPSMGGDQISPWTWVATSLGAMASTLVAPWSQGAQSASAAASIPFGPPTALRCLFSAFEAFGQDVGALDSLAAADWRSGATEMAHAMSACGVSAQDAAAALADVAVHWPGPQWLITASAGVQRTYGDQAHPDPMATTAAWHAAGRSASDTLAGLRVLYGIAVVTPGSDITAWSGAFGPHIVDLEPAVWTTWQLNATLEYATESVKTLTGAPQPAYRQQLASILTAVQRCYALSATDFASLLLHAGLPGLDLAESMQLSRADAASALVSAGFPPTEIARAVMADRYGGLGGAVATMVGAGCHPADTAQAVLTLIRPSGQGSAGLIPDWQAQQVLTDLKTACDAAQPGQLTPEDLAAAVAPFVRTIILLAFLKSHYDLPMETLANAVKAAVEATPGWDDSAESAAAEVFGLSPTLRWMYATQGAAANFDDPIDRIFEEGGGQPNTADLAQAMADAGIQPSVTARWLNQKRHGDDGQQVLSAIQAAYKMTPEQAAGLLASS